MDGGRDHAVRRQQGSYHPLRIVAGEACPAKREELERSSDCSTPNSHVGCQQFVSLDGLSGCQPGQQHAALPTDHAVCRQQRAYHPLRVVAGEACPAERGGGGVRGMYIYIYLYIYMYKYMFKGMCIFVYIYTYICAYMYIHICRDIYI